MARFDFGAADRDPRKQKPMMKAGVYLVEVASATEEKSRGQEDMITLKLKDVQTGWTVCFDRLMLSGGGINITSGKLRILGIDGHDEMMFEADQLVGRRVQVKCKVRKYNDQESLEVDINAPAPFQCGYMPEHGPESLVPLDMPNF